MGWGCYRHECDMGSEAATTALKMLVEREQDRHFPAWGRDEAICPLCYAELLNFAQLAYTTLANWIKNAPNSVDAIMTLGANVLESKHGLGVLPDAEFLTRVLALTENDDARIGYTPTGMWDMHGDGINNGDYLFDVVGEFGMWVFDNNGTWYTGSKDRQVLFGPLSAQLQRKTRRESKS